MSDASETPIDDSDKVVRRRASSRSSTRNLVEWLAVILISVILALVIKSYVVQAFKIPSGSMISTLDIGDRVLVNKLSYDAHDPNRGDIVVFTRPPDLPASPGEPDDLIKRVIGLPGDSVVARDGHIYINDKLLKEPYLDKTALTFDLDNPVTVPEGEVFVMGDNRTRSEDSRIFGPIDEDTIIGRAFMIVWPINRIGSL